MSQVNVGLIQMCSTTSVAKNLAIAEQLIAEASKQGAELIVLPEYFPIFAPSSAERLAAQESGNESGPIQQALQQWANTYQAWLVAGTMPVRSDNPEKPYARSYCFNANGECVAAYDKIHLFDVEVNDSTGRYCESDNTAAGRLPQVVETPWGKLGLSVCYDLRFAELYRYYHQQGCVMISAPSAFTCPTGKAHWEVLLRARAIETQSFVLAAAQVGAHENGRMTWGHSMVVDPWGEIVGELGQQEGCLVVPIDLQQCHNVAKRMPIRSHRVLN